MSLRSIPLTLTTRGIGIAVVNIVEESRRQIHHIPYSDSSDDDYIPRKFDDHPSIYALYRACLGLLETRLKFVSHTPFTTIYKNDYVNNELFAYYDLINVWKVPSPIERIINAVGVVRCGDRVYHPVVAAPVYYDNGKLMPRSENVLLSTLRQTVQALADPDTPEHDRVTFKNTCAIPGAIWNDNNTLNNPDDIIPHNYYENKLQENDLRALDFYTRYHRNTYLSGKPLGTSLNGRKSLLVSCKLIDIKMKPRKQGESPVDYYKRCGYDQNTRGCDISSPESLSYQNQLQGAHNLLGEIPDFDTPHVIYYPRYEINHTYVASLPGFISLIEDIIIDETQEEKKMLQRSIPMTITSRGIGFYVAQFARELYINNQRRFNREVIPEDLIYKLYRVSLGVFERRLQKIRPNTFCSEVLSKDEQYHSRIYFSDQYGFLPKSIMNIVNDIGVVKHEGREYHPVVAKPVFYDKGKLMPRSENVLLSTLRQTVQALADPDTPEHDRIRFKNTCPIPGAIWNDDNTLNNPDDIISQCVCETHFQEDMSEVMSYINFRNCDDTMINIHLNEDTNTGGRSMLLSNMLLEMQVSPRHTEEPIEEYLNRCRVEGDMNGHFTSPEHMNKTEQVKGLLQLFGEVPTDYQKYYRHIYAPREQICHAYGRLHTEYENLYTHYKSLEKANNNDGNNMVRLEESRERQARGGRGRRRRRGRGCHNQYSH